MNFYKKVFFFIFLALISFYLVLGLIFYISYAKPTFVSNIFGGPAVEHFTSFLANRFSNKGFSKLYYINTKILSDDKSTFLLDYSNNDFIKSQIYLIYIL